ncbi:MAG: hypothetical protein ACON4Z_12755, partial [Planctomycetota bacterium]
RRRRPSRWRPRLRPPTRRGAAALAALVMALLWWTAQTGGDGATPTWPRRTLLDAIRWVESRHAPDASVPDGDDGLAIGPYQIHRVYWADAAAFDPTLGGTYQDCRRRAYAERVVDAYMRRYAADAWRDGDGERVARVHNGGPNGHRKRATDAYWRRVRARLPAPR